MKEHSYRNRAPLPAAIAFAGVMLILAGCGQPFRTGLRALYPEQQVDFFAPPGKFVAVDCLQPTLKWESFPRSQDLTGSMADLYKRAEDVNYELVISELSHLDQVYRRSGLTEEYHRIETPLKPHTKYFWTVRACFRLDNEPRCTQWGALSEWEYSAMWHPNFWSYRFVTPD
jgi:hypothetical protein